MMNYEQLNLKNVRKALAAATTEDDIAKEWNDLQKEVFEGLGSDSFNGVLAPAPEPKQKGSRSFYLYDIVRS